ncbi:MAG: bifunctional 4-hydroxy-2-oxoglutarate aldolase/2-dehydro-3-deoxy-phosphogluconate aldolase [Pseudomonadota bacterium]
MTCELSQRLQTAPIVPLIDPADPVSAVQTAQALAAGGVTVIEVVMRSPAAQAGMEAVVAETSEVMVGAGTVLTLEQARSVHASGAQFIVSPGLVDDIALYCMAEGIPCLPGTMTPSEMQRAHALGLRTVKFFPAGLAGGTSLLKAVSGVFRELRFMPTGGVSAENLADYLALPNVLACGGSWLTPKEAIAAKDYALITALAREALMLAHETQRAS